MTTMQDKFFRLLEEWTDSEGLELVTSKSFSNVGTLYIQKKGSFNTLLELHFDFQHGKVTLGDMVRTVRSRPIFTGKPNPYFAGFTATSLDQALDYIVEAVEHDALESERDRRPCGHPAACAVTAEGTSYCGWCAAEADRDAWKRAAKAYVARSSGK